MELVKENLKLNNIIGVENYKTVIENDIIVPDINPDVGNILLNDTNIVINESQVANDKIHIEGMIYYKIIYTTEENQGNTKGITTGMKFTASFDMVNVKPEMKCIVYSDIEHIELNILNGRKINAKTLARFYIRVCKESELQMISEIRDVEDLQVLKSNKSVCEYLGRIRDSITIKENIIVPVGNSPMKEILRNDVMVLDKTIRTTDDKVIVKGSLSVCTLYIGDDENRLQTMEHEVPYEYVAELGGTDELSVVYADINVGGIKAEISEDTDGELRVINFEADLKVNIEGFKERNIEVIEDAYSIRSSISIDRESIRASQVYDDFTNQAVYKETISLEQGYPELGSILNAYNRVIFSDYSINEGKAVVEGYVESSLLYYANEDERAVNCFTKEIPFKQAIDINENLHEIKPCISLSVEGVSYSIVSGSDVDLRFVIVIDLRYAVEQQFEFASKAVEKLNDESMMEKKPGITVYFSKSGDSLWKIAKKYKITIDSITVNNNISEQDILSEGKQLIILR